MTGAFSFLKTGASLLTWVLVFQLLFVPVIQAETLTEEPLEIMTAVSDVLQSRFDGVGELSPQDTFSFDALKEEIDFLEDSAVTVASARERYRRLMNVNIEEQRVYFKDAVFSLTSSEVGALQTALSNHSKKDLRELELATTLVEKKAHILNALFQEIEKRKFNEFKNLNHLSKDEILLQFKRGDELLKTKKLKWKRIALIAAIVVTAGVLTWLVISSRNTEKPDEGDGHKDEDKNTFDPMDPCWVFLYELPTFIMYCTDLSAEYYTCWEEGCWSTIWENTCTGENYFSSCN